MVDRDYQMRNKSILFVSYNCSSNETTFFLLELARHWKGTAKIKCEFLFIGSSEDGLRVEFEKLGRTHFSVECLKTTSLDRFDLVFNNSFTNGMFLSELNRFSVPVISYVRELEFALRGMRPSVSYNTLKFSDHFIACSKAVKSILHELFNIKNDSISVANGFVSMESLNEACVVNKDGQERTSAELKPFHVGVLANMDYQMGIDRFLSILPILPDRIIAREVRWAWCGNGAKFYEKLLSHNVFDRVSLIEPLDNPRDFLSDIDLLFSFAREDPFALTNLQALLRKIPVAGIGDSGGIDELEEMGYATTCRFTASGITELLMDFIEGERVFPDKPFLWSTEIGAPKVIEIANRFLNRSFFTKFQSRRPGFDFSSIGQLESPDLNRKLPSCSYDEFVLATDRRSPSKMDGISGTSAFLFSIIVPTHKPKLGFLQKAIESVKAQVYENWELIIVDDASDDPKVMEFLNNSKKGDSRIKVCSLSSHRHISFCSNHGVRLSCGSWVGFLDQDDELHPNALASSFGFLSMNPEAQIVYTDEDKIDESGNRFDPYFKPDWNPRLLLSQNYFCHFLLIEKKLFENAGGFREGFEGAQDWDLSLRATNLVEARSIGHICEVLYHWRAHSGSTSLSLKEKGDWVGEAQEKTIRSHLSQTGINALPQRSFGNHWEIIPPHDFEQPKTCLVYYGDTHDARKGKIMSATAEKTHRPNLDILVPRQWRKSSSGDCYDKGDLKEKLQSYEAIAFLLPEVEPVHPDWLERLVFNSQGEGVGFVGPKLLHAATSLVLSAGMVLQDGKVSSLYESSTLEYPGDKYRAMLAQNMTYLHPAALVGQAKTILPFLEAGELSTSSLLRLCERMSLSGHRNLFLPSSCCYYHGNDKIFFTRAEEFSHDDSALENGKDPSFNPNLCLPMGVPLPRKPSAADPVMSQ